MKYAIYILNMQSHAATLDAPPAPASKLPAPKLARWLPEGEQPCPEDELPWMSQEDLAPAWAVSTLTLAALALLSGLAILG